MIIIGVTGNTGAGKSTISTIIKNNSGALVIDADQLARQMLVPGEKYFDDVLKAFGKEILFNRKQKHKGKINNSKLAMILFENDEKRETMNKLTFKYIGKKTKELILENQDREIVVLDFPLLYEGKFDKICNYVIGVVADEETKILRVTERDRITNAQALSRLNVQIDEEELKEKADYIIDNSYNTRYITLVNEVVRIVHKIKKDEEEKKKTKK